MANYLQSVLRPDEEIIYSAKLHWVVYLPALILIGLYFVALVVAVNETNEQTAVWLWLFGFLSLFLGIASLASAFIKRWTTELVITDRRALAKIGFIRRQTWEINRPAIEGVQVDQSILGRILGYGTILVTGRGSGLAPIKNVDDPISFRNHVPLD